jgi:hypothetical protein
MIPVCPFCALTQLSIALASTSASIEKIVRRAGDRVRGGGRKASRREIMIVVRASVGSGRVEVERMDEYNER